MRVRHYEDMDLQELSVTKEIDSIGTSHAAAALSKLSLKEIQTTFPEVNVLGYEETVSYTDNPEEIIAVALVRMDGDVEGLMLFLFNLEFANTVFDKLMGESFSDLTKPDEISYSASVEVGNIIICSYINAFSQLVGVEVELSVSSATVNILGNVLTVSTMKYGHETDKLMYSNADFIMEREKLPGWLLTFPDIDSLNEILDKLGVL